MHVEVTVLISDRNRFKGSRYELKIVSKVVGASLCKGFKGCCNKLKE